MSKSKGNVVNPDQYIEEYGADTLRTYLMFLGPYHQGGDFSDRGIAGIRRFLNRVWQLTIKHRDCLESNSPDLDSQRHLHQTIDTHLTEELWHQIGESFSIHQQRFPHANPEFLTPEQVKIAVQINGRTRTTILLSPSAKQEEAIAVARQTEAIQRYIENKEIRRVVYVPGRILNLVT